MNSRAYALRRLVLGVCLLFGLVLTGQPAFTAALAPRETWAGVLKYETQSQFSHIRIRRQGDVRSLIFVRDNGDEALENRIDLTQPYVLQLDYLRFFFTSFLLRPQQEDVLIVGLGAGAMIHFLRHIAPELRVDVVEIDPVVVDIAAKYFDTRPGGGVNIITGDGLQFLAETGKRYDVIYLDAFLKPSADTDATGAPRDMHSQRFYKTIQARLKPGGLVAFNFNAHANLAQDVRNVEQAFPQTYVFPLVQFGGAIALGSTDARRVEAGELEQRGRELDHRFGAQSISYHQMALRLRRH